MQGEPCIGDDLTGFEWLSMGPNTIAWEVTLTGTDGSHVTDPVLPIRRSLSCLKPFRLRPGSGRIAFNHALCLTPGWRTKHIGSRVHNSEYALYGRWRAVEVQLDAGCDALREGTWFRPRFGFRTAEDTWTYQLGFHWGEYLRREGRTIVPFAAPKDSWDTLDVGFRKYLMNTILTLEMAKEL